MRAGWGRLCGAGLVWTSVAGGIFGPSDNEAVHSAWGRELSVQLPKTVSLG